jgi:hypothetical protein
VGRTVRQMVQEFLPYSDKLSIVILQTLCQAIFGVVTVNGCPGEAEWFRLASGLKGKWARVHPKLPGCLSRFQGSSLSGCQGFISAGNSVREIQGPGLKRAWPRYAGRPGMKTSPPAIGALRPPKLAIADGLLIRRSEVRILPGAPSMRAVTPRFLSAVTMGTFTPPRLVK